MPTYDYVCDSCDYRFELFQNITESAKRKCPKCKKSRLRRLIGTGAGILFKGSGFYTTDYRSDSYKKAAEADKKAAAPPSTGDKPAGPDKSSKKSKPND
jgi:putative FmdB family regulatory protein